MSVCLQVVVGSEMTQYVAPELAQLIHRVPHVNASLQPVSSQFNLSSVSYTEVNVSLDHLSEPATERKPFWLVLWDLCGCAIRMVLLAVPSDKNMQ